MQQLGVSYSCVSGQFHLYDVYYIDHGVRPSRARAANLAAHRRYLISGSQKARRFPSTSTWHFNVYRSKDLLSRHVVISDERMMALNDSDDHVIQVYR